MSNSPRMGNYGREVRAWWSRGPSPGNLGDVLTPIVLAGLGYSPRWVGLGVAEFLGIGSIVRFAAAQHTVWGSGAMWERDRPSPQARYLAVRGPLTRRIVQRNGGECPEVYGDPALLLPRFHDAPVEKRYDMGYVPHYREPLRGAADVVISPLSKDPLAVVDRIRACRAIVSSSLHGIVVAHAYGIPAAWLHSGKLAGDGTKFRDYAASVGVELTPYRTIAEAVPVLPPPFDGEPLVRALVG